MPRPAHTGWVLAAIWHASPPPALDPDRIPQPCASGEPTTADNPRSRAAQLGGTVRVLPDFSIT